MSSPDVAAQRDRFADWPAPARYVVLGIVLALFLSAAGAVAGLLVVHRPLPQTSGTLDLPGLRAPVTVYRDDHGVPQIWAKDAADLFRAQGFVAAQDRFWQMDYRRHAASGRLSELMGKQALPSDLVARTLGFRAVAEQELDGLSDQTQDALSAFSSGVNAWLDEHSGGEASVEYTLLSLNTGYHPADWTPVDSLAWFKAMAWDLSGGGADEVTRASLSVGADAAEVAELYPTYDASAHPTVVPSATSMPGDGAAAGSAGGNAWVVSGRLTTTGKPLLAADPHLTTGLPGELYQVGLHCRTVSTACPYDVSGLTYAGIPGVVSGHDATASWALTDSHADDVDLYLEKVTGDSVLYDGQQAPLASHDEQIRVADGAPRTVTVRSTRHGPLLSDVSGALSSAGVNAQVPDGSPDRGSGYAVAVSWSGLTPSRSFDAVLALDRAAGWVDVQAAAALLTTPAQGIVYADVGDHIGYQATGALPVRPVGVTGQDPVPGWLPADDPTGQTVAFAELPSSYDPPSGVIVAADQPLGSATAEGNVGYDYGYRSARILRLLRTGTQEDARLRVADMLRIQRDTRSPMAPTLVPYLLDVAMPGSFESGGQRLLAGWNYSQPADSAAAAYFNVVWRNLLALTFHDQLRRSVWPDGGSRWVAVMSRLLQRPDDPWWDDVDTTKVEDRDDILAESMREARSELVRRQARDPQSWTWGHLHQLRLDSPLIEGFGGLLLDRDGRGAPGGSGAVASTDWDAASVDVGVGGRDDYDVTTAPAARLVVDLGDLDRSRWVLATGESGHAFSGTYLDQTDLMLTGRTIAWPASRAAVRAAAKDVLTLH